MVVKILASRLNVIADLLLTWLVKWCLPGFILVAAFLQDFRDLYRFYGVPDLCVDVKKEVWAHGAWRDANTAGEMEQHAVPAPADAEYRVSVTNCGAVDLVNVDIDDTDLPVAVDEAIASLAAGETQGSRGLRW